MATQEIITVSVEGIPQVRTALERERLAARASLAALLLVTDPRASQHLAAARPRVRAGYLLVADQLLDAYDIGPLPEAAPGQQSGLTYTVVSEDEDGAGYTAVFGEAGPPGFVASLHDALVRAALKGLANVVTLTHAKLSTEPDWADWASRHLADARTHAINLAAQVMISARAAASDPPGSALAELVRNFEIAEQRVLEALPFSGSRPSPGEGELQLGQLRRDADALGRACSDDASPAGRRGAELAQRGWWVIAHARRDGEVEDATRRSIASFIRAGAHWLRSDDSSEALKALVGCTATAFEVLAKQIEMGDDKVGLVGRLEAENAGEAKRRFFQSIVDSDATRDATLVLARLDELRNTAIPCARIRDELLAPVRRFLGDIVRPLPHLDAVSAPPQNRGAR